MIIIAHRGASAYAPENTMASFRLARAQKARGIELDVHFSADGKIVVIHDFTLNRTGGADGPVAAKTLAELRELDFGAWFGYGNEMIPELRDVLDFISQTDMILNIELKIDPLAYDAGLTGKTAELVTETGLLGRVIVSSFYHPALSEIKTYNAGIKTGILYVAHIDRVWDYAASCGADYIHPMHLNLTKEVVDGCHARGIGVNAWTADSEADIMRLLDIGADAVITNKPDIALACTTLNG